MTDEIVPFRIDVPDADLVDLRERLARTRWPEAETVDDWSQGIPLAYVQDLCDYWATKYDWRASEARLNAFPQFRTELDGLGIHFLHVRSPEPDALPLVITHGWPGSIVEFHKVIGPLTDPVAHGGDAADAFHVVCPSLPGYGFSDRPTQPGWKTPRIADAWATLMARLGYDRYGAQGGDWGASVTTSIGQQDAEHVVGHPPQHGDRVPGPVDGRADASRSRPRSSRSRTTSARSRATRRSSRPDRRRSGTGSSTPPPGRPRGSSRSSGRGPTATATPRTC